jgi:hypothetical protein
VNRKRKATACSPCAAGTYSSDLARNCTLCPVGTKSVRHLKK